MGGHSDGSRAADTALKSLLDSFQQTPLPMFDPLGFLHMALSRAHDDVARLGNGQSIDARPRATSAICLVQEGAAYWAHIGDSRVYHLRHGKVLERTRDHSHVELLLREGKITEEELPNHPMRNFVECCLGGDPGDSRDDDQRPARCCEPGDVLLLCTDGIWANLRDDDIAGVLSRTTSRSCEPGSKRSGVAPCRRPRRSATTRTAAVLRWLGD